MNERKSDVQIIMCNR